jgi:uncharacterized protein with PQ loop repeat
MNYTATIAVLVSVLAPLINCIQHLPQLHRIVKTKRVKDVSRVYLFCLLLAEILWLLHGSFVHDWSLIISCSIGIMVLLVIVVLHHVYS